MKKIMMLCLMLTLVPIVAHADQAPAHKFLRGVFNVATAPIEVPKQARAYWIKGAQKTPHIIAWIGCGVAWGFVQTVKRLGSGVWDVVSFPFAKPADYEPLLKPDYVFQEWPINPNSGR